MKLTRVATEQGVCAEPQQRSLAATGLADSKLLNCSRSFFRLLILIGGDITKNSGSTERIRFQSFNLWEESARTMKNLALGICATLFLATVWLSVFHKESASAGNCIVGDYCPWQLAPTGTTANGTGQFTATLSFNYAFIVIPDEAFVEFDSSASSGISSVGYCPTWWEPNHCNEGIPVDVEGQLSDKCTSGTLVTKGTARHPSSSCSSTHSLAVTQNGDDC